MSYPPDPNNPYGQPQQAPYGVPQQQNPYGQPQQQAYGYPQQAAPGYGYPQQAAPGYGYPQAAPPVLASWGARVGASFIDFLVVGLPSTIGTIIGIGMVATSVAKSVTNCPTDSYGTPICPTPSSGITGGGMALILIGSLLSLILGIWQLVREGSTGQTIGKKAVGIRLVREMDGTTLGFGLAFVRRIAHALDSLLCGIGYLWPIWDDKGQTFADKVCNTLVIRA
ncbi:hypothetical protein GCM10009665_62360 [Kitasatospora nipponensis]|uniref:RDD domain-containing protein n=1 Tax=Kitasatospora nipponensis TaxID=258049 RepID=A0ABN1WVI3_9ACTN